MRRPLASGLAAGLALGALARRRLRARVRLGALGSEGIGLSDGVDQVGLALLQATGVAFVGGNRLAWRDDAAVFDAIEEAIRAARHSVHVELYIWKPGGPGTRIAELVRQRRRDGVAVRILVDPFGSGGFKEELYGPLTEAGCEVRYFRAPRARFFSLTGRNHRKLVVVDGRVAFTGGFGISREWTGEGEPTGAWRDANVEVEGPVVRDMQASFAAHWLETGGSLLPRSELERAVPAGDARAAYVTSSDVKGLSHARWVTHIALMAAQRRAWVANSYFVPQPEVLGTLLLLPRRGVEVRLLLPGPHQDHPAVTFLQRRLYPILDRREIAVFEYQPSMMHAKTMLVDERLVVVGSINLDYLSMNWLEEGCLVADDRTFAAALEARWRLDLDRSRRVSGARRPRDGVRNVEGPAAEAP